MKGPAAALLPLLAASAAALALANGALARGGNVVYDGGTPAEQAQVRAALGASAFDFSVIPATVTVHIARGGDSRATPGQVWLDADLLDAGRYSWGVVQHEFGHEVDFFLLTDATRAELTGALGGRSWWAPSSQAMAPNGTPTHAQLASERFASTLAWAYWPSPDNTMRPLRRSDESAAMAPFAFRRLLASILAARTTATQSR